MAPEIEFYLVARNTDPDIPLKPPIGRSGRAETSRQAYSIDAVNEFDPLFEDVYDYCEKMELERRHADPRDRRRPDGDQLLPRSPAGPRRRGVLLQTHAARGRAAPRHVRHLHGQADRRRAGKRDAHPPERGRQDNRQEHLQQRGRHASRSSSGTSAACRSTCRQRWPLRAPYVNSYRRLVRSNAAPINIQWGTDNRTVGIRSPVAGPAARRIENRVIGADANPYAGAGRDAGLWLPGHPEPRRADPECKGDAYLGDFQLPRSLGEAVDLLRENKDLASVLGQPFVTVYTEVKRGNRIRRVHEGHLTLGARAPAAARLTRPHAHIDRRHHECRTLAHPPCRSARRRSGRPRTRHTSCPSPTSRRCRPKGSRIITHAENIYLWDSDGAKILDAMSACGASTSATAVRN